MYPWLLVDVSYLAHRARHALEGFEWEDLPTGVLFGFFEQLRALQRDDRLQSNRVVFMLDSRKSHRRIAFPNYKRKRREDLTDEDRKKIQVMHDQIHLLSETILPGTGFQCHRQTGCESDDLMAKAAEQFTGPERQAVIITADGDLYQCISPAVHWYDPARKVYHDPQSFKEKKRVTPKQWGIVKSLAGCSGDGVPGIPGVGEKSAVDFILGELPTGYKRYTAIMSTEGRLIQQRNLGLVLLPHKKTKPFPLLEPDYNADAFFGFCERYGIMSYLKEPKRSEWAAFFKGPIQTRRRSRCEQA